MIPSWIRASAILATLAIAAALGPAARAAAGTLVWERPAPAGATAFGSRVANAGDVDGDDKDDVFVSAGTLPNGTIYVLSGADGATLRTFRGNLSASPALLEEAHSAGDFDHDGIPDFLLGARASGDLLDGEVGYFAVISGKLACDGLVLSADCEAPADSCVLLRVCGDAHADTFGDRMANVGDVNGDGVVDILAGIPGAYFAAPGTARLYSGSDGAVLFSVNGLGPQDNLGYAVAGVGDVTGDGVADFAIGAPGVPKKRRPMAGNVLVYSGATFTLVRTFKGRPLDMVGTSIASTGLVDGDAYPDIVYGVPGDDRRSVLDAGLAVLVSGRTGKKLRKVKGSAAHLLMGMSVVPLGDLDGDGAGDFATGASPTGVNGTFGRVGVYSGSCGCGLLIYDGPEAHDGTGSSVGAADVTGDGRSELVVGMPSSSSHPGGIVRVLSLQ